MTRPRLSSVPAAPSTVDLHAHSSRSDGVLAPTQLIRDVAAAGVRVFSLTDHDTLAGYRDLIRTDALPPGMTLIPGIEINALVTRDLGLWEGELHILGFGMDPDDAFFEATLAVQRDARRLRFDRTVDLLREVGMPIDAQLEGHASAQDDALGRPTVARALVAAGFAASVEDAFDRIIGHGKPGYVRREGLGRRRPSTRSEPPAVCLSSPTSVKPPPGQRSCASSSTRVWPASRSTTARSTRRPSTPWPPSLARTIS